MTAKKKLSAPDKLISARFCLRLLVPLFISAGLLGFTQTAGKPQPVNTQDFLRTDGQGVVTVHDPVAPVSFELPAGWLLTSGVRWGDHETTLALYDTGSHRSSSVYYQYPIQTAVPFDLDAALVAGMERKVKQRQDRERFRDYRIRADSGQTSVVDGRPAFSYVGEFTNARGQAFSEYNMRVIGADTKIEFFAMLPVPEDPVSFAARIAPLIHSLRMP